MCSKCQQAAYNQPTYILTHLLICSSTYGTLFVCSCIVAEAWHGFSRCEGRCQQLRTEGTKTGRSNQVNSLVGFYHKLTKNFS